ncbi:MAG: 4-(cytidine 5'-diphospho)-2-C-methyl-D-erythritol kinase, partial [Desulfopila sp.]
AGKGAVMHLEKRIPVSAGLGGGSSDAGTLLRELNRYFSNELDGELLLHMATSLGADVPFFVQDASSVLAAGIGEKMVAVPPLRDATFILVHPGIGISTAAIFAKFALTRAQKNSTLTGFQKLCPEDLSHVPLENDLEEVTIGLFPIIGEIKKVLESLGAETVLMSGSGSTVFGVFRGAVQQRTQKAKDAVSRLRQEFGRGVFLAE